MPLWILCCSNHALTHSRTHALTHSRTYALTHLRTFALTHSRTLRLRTPGRRLRHVRLRRAAGFLAGEGQLVHEVHLALPVIADAQQRHVEHRHAAWRPPLERSVVR